MSTNAELEAWIRAHPDDRNGWRGYGDWLGGHGDGGGGVGHLEHRLQAPALPPEEADAVRKRVEALTAEHEPGWLEGLVAPGPAELTWRSGFVVGVRFERWGSESLGELERLAAHPTARLLASLA